MEKKTAAKREREKELVSQMIFYHPITAIRHVIETRKEKKRLEKANED